MGVCKAAESMAIVWPWLARMTQSAGVVDSRSGEARRGLGFMEKRCLAFSVTAVRMSSNVAWRLFSRCHFSYRALATFRSHSIQSIHRIYIST